LDDETTAVSDGPSRRVLAGRYVLQGLLGQGGMADVELAYDKVLDRQVAVKLLHQRYTDDPAFLERFKREARAAASLNHANMVAVYDTGEQDARPYIVMEYVAGRSLRDLLRREGVMPDRAGEIASDAALGLDYAHERGLVHRDIKPANIMLSDEGQVKVTDFGIARAAGVDTVTQTAAVFGTAAYIAPEQAQGESVDRRTDVYSLGVVLYEMLTGRQPFTADSAVALAYKHVSEPPEPPSQINDEISPALESVVLRAMAKNPDNRYQTAHEFHDDIQRAAQGQPVSAPPVMAYATTQAIRRDPADTAMITTGARRYVEDEYTPPPDHPGRRRFGYVMLALLLLAVVAAAVFALTRLFATDSVRQVVVPDVEGMQVERAERELRDADLRGEVVERVEDPRVGEGRVISSDPPAEVEVPENSIVALVISTGTPTVQVPRLRGLTEDDARGALQQAGLSIGETEEARSDDIEAGLVIRSDPAAGSEVTEGSDVSYVVSAGPESVRLPDVSGDPESVAAERLRNACATAPCVEVAVVRTFDDSVDQGDAIRTEPEAGSQVPFGSTVTLVVSQGSEPEPEPVPTEPEPEPTEPEPTEPEPTEPEPTEPEPTEPEPTEPEPTERAVQPSPTEQGGQPPPTEEAGQPPPTEQAP
jgi:serine/threonine-protein kinase